MNIELRNVKYAAFASEETSCFQAVIYVDGARAGTARNDGHGGITFIEPRALEQRIEAYAATLPVRHFEDGSGEVFDLAPNAELLIGELLEAFLLERDLRRHLAKRIMFTKPGKRGIYQTSVLPKDRLDGLLRNPAVLRSKFPEAEVILNLLPFAEALALYGASAK